MAQWTERSFVSCGKVLRWRADVVENKCSKCNRWALNWFGRDKYDYCPNCGKRMENASNTIKDYKRGND